MSLRDFWQRVVTGTGVLCVFCAAMYWYRYTHHKIRCWDCGFAAFTLFRWLLDAVLIVLLFYIVRSNKGSGLQQDGIDSSEAREALSNLAGSCVCSTLPDTITLRPRCAT